MPIFGPVPSRRLGRSLGINNIPPKSCSYSCLYCQVGPTRVTEIEPRGFYAPELLCREVTERVALLRERQEPIDYLTFVPDGEPTLDARLGETIDRLRPLGIPIAVISNASLIWRQDVRETLAKADWISLKVDAVDEGLWRRVNRPHAALDLRAILAGILDFSRQYNGLLATETLLVAGVNDQEIASEALAVFLEELEPDLAYLAIPLRPPAERSVGVPDEATLNRVFQTLRRRVPQLELMAGYEGNAFSASGNAVEDILSISAVHPLREEAVAELLAKGGAGWGLVERLLAEGLLIRTEYQGRNFYVRRIPEPGA